ncbi:hypothetical protein BDFB_013872 [Asbolus verrucosus]|uniref:Uncharacterized protein n=1 Tax=Asbolus verrucosus TaxID=1661398 RepID=A0A482WBH0_ASBVE|nr:hypothetical protein BDFB_013872 [Asbolus verrucosus]
MENGLILCKLALKKFGNVSCRLCYFFLSRLSFLETGSSDNKKSTGRPKKKTPEVVMEVWGFMEATPSK